MKKISIIIPFYNEYDNILALHEEINSAMSEVNIPYEIIYIDDGSTDGTTQRIRKIAETDPNVLGILFRKNFGQTSAFSAGIDHASGEVIITMDGDRQNDPRDIVQLLKKIEEGYDVVSGWRYNRKDTIMRRLPSRVANKLISIVTGVHLHDYGCSLKAYRADIMKNIRLYGELHRFIPALCHSYGASIAEIKINHRPRIKGKSKYGLGRTFRVILDLLTVKFLLSYSTRPSHVFGVLGIISMIAGIAINVYFGFIRIFLQQAIANRPLLLLGILLTLAGVQFICFGLLAEMMARIYHETQNKSIYSIKTIISHKENSDNQKM